MYVFRDHRIGAATGLLLALMAVVGGCSQKIVITQYPAFYTRALQTMAVVPFRNQTRWGNAGDIVSDKLAAALSANGAYTVYNRNHFRTLMDESDLRLAFGEDPTAAAGAFKKHTNVTAILTGAVTTYSATSNKQRKQDPIYAWDANGNMYVSGYRRYIWTRNEANIAVTATLIRVADGSTIHATPATSYRAWAEGESPRRDRHGCSIAAADGVVRQLVETFAPVRKIIKVDPSKALRIANDLYDGEWTFCKEIDSAGDKMYVVVTLPSSCDRNPFRITIIRKGQRQTLAEQPLVWTGKYGSYGYAFDAADIVAKGGGPGEYEAKFYSGQKPVLRRTFRIK